MSNLSKQRWDEAANVNIVPLIEKMDCTLYKHGTDHLGATYCPICNKNSRSKNTHFVVTLSKNMYKCFVCGSGGDPIQLYMDYYGIKHSEAISMLIGDSTPDTEENKKERLKRQLERGVKERTIIIAEKQKQLACMTALTAIYKAARKLKPEDVSPQALSYLEDQRMIPRNILRDAWRVHRFALMPDSPDDAAAFIRNTVKEDILIKAGILKNKGGKMAIQFRPILFPFGDGNGHVTSMEFRAAGDIDFGEKSYRYGKAVFPWLWRQPNANHSTVVEGAIDGISLVALGYKGDVIAVPGIQNWRQEWCDIIGSNKVYIAFDNDSEPLRDYKKEPVGKDENGDPIHPPKLDKAGKIMYPGEQGAIKLAATLKAYGKTPEIRLPGEKGTDINSFLQHQIKESMESNNRPGGN